MLAFPTSFFLWQFYTEALFIALAAGALLAQERERFWLAGALAGAMAMTRAPGIGFTAVLVVAHVARRRRIDRDMAWYALGPAGLLVVAAVQWVQAGDAFGFATSPGAWGRHISVPWTPLVRSFEAYARGKGPAVVGIGGSARFHPVIGSPRDLVAIVLFLALGAIAFVRPWPWSARALIAIMVLGPMSTGAVVGSARYVLAAWPGFAVLADELRRVHRRLPALVVALLIFASVAVLHDWTRGFFIE
jgi:hypothetical protein